ncbi:MAG: hypothetical protein LBM07_06280 [Culturomica sp.]|nr:hypothetical protein [Culturomica sp.]
MYRSEKLRREEAENIKRFGKTKWMLVKWMWYIIYIAFAIGFVLFCNHFAARQIF